MSFSKYLFRTVGIVSVGYIGYKGINVIINDEFSDIKYNIKRKYVASINKESNTSPKPKVVVLGTGWGALSFIQHIDKDKVE